MKAGLLITFFCTALQFVQAQSTAKQWGQQQIPKGWLFESVTVGDLNNDQQQDVAIVYRNNLKKNFILNEGGLGMDSLDTNPRMLLIAFKHGSAYKKILSTTQFLPSRNDAENQCLVDPLGEGGITISKGVLKVHLNYWVSCGSWYVTDYTYTFRYQNQKMELIGLDVSSFSRASGEKNTTSINYLTRKKQVITGLNEFEESNQPPKEKWTTIPKKPLYNLAAITAEMLQDVM